MFCRYSTVKILPILHNTCTADTVKHRYSRFFTLHVPQVFYNTFTAVILLLMYFGFFIQQVRQVLNSTGTEGISSHRKYCIVNIPKVLYTTVHVMQLYNSTCRGEFTKTNSLPKQICFSEPKNRLDSSV